ncbi:MAG: WYL domain-containing protein [Bacteroidetes bacterium]|nr:WYL domain-containing protein [Bacteroidota bacterium]MBU1717804.1 WYL domain-containing protein [Bacteroidota bacterium]
MAEVRADERAIRLLLMLSSGGHFTLDTICERFECSSRTAQRTIRTLRDIGFVISVNKDGFYHAEVANKQLTKVSGLLQFTREETDVLSRAIYSVSPDNALKSCLLKKLKVLYQTEGIADTFINTMQSEVISKLSVAIRERKQVILKEYKSANSLAIRDRQVEPFQFNSEFITFWAYDPCDMQCKTFKTARVASVEVLPKSWMHKEHHQVTPVDVFRISGRNKHHVKLALSLRAVNLLVEEYPLSGEKITMVDDKIWHFEDDVHGFEGVGRFVMGLPGDVQIVESEEFRRYIKKESKKLRTGC